MQITSFIALADHLEGKDGLPCANWVRCRHSNWEQLSKGAIMKGKLRWGPVGLRAKKWREAGQLRTPVRQYAPPRVSKNKGALEEK